MMATPKFTVAIVGGGIGGLASAIAIARLNPANDIKLDIYEGAHAFTEIGAGVGLWKRPWSIMKKLGLADDLAKICKASVISDEIREFDDAFLRILSYQRRTYIRTCIPSPKV